MVITRCPYCAGLLYGNLATPCCSNPECELYGEPIPRQYVEDLCAYRAALYVAITELRCRNDEDSWWALQKIFHLLENGSFMNGVSDKLKIENDPSFIRGQPPKDWVKCESTTLPDGYEIYSNRKSIFDGDFRWGIFKIDTKKENNNDR